MFLNKLYDDSLAKALQIKAALSESFKKQNAFLSDGQPGVAWLGATHSPHCCGSMHITAGWPSMLYGGGQRTVQAEIQRVLKENIDDNTLSRILVAHYLQQCVTYCGNRVFIFESPPGNTFYQILTEFGFTKLCSYWNPQYGGNHLCDILVCHPKVVEAQIKANNGKHTILWPTSLSICPAPGAAPETTSESGVTTPSGASGVITTKLRKAVLGK